ncbi:MAG: FAD binding domain-containing protein [Pseudomonadota bacterium]
MKPAPFDYARAKTVADAASLAAQAGSNATFLAGGQSLIAMLNMRVASPKLLIDVSRVEDGQYIRETDDHVAIGCAVRQVELERWSSLNRCLPLVAKAIPWVGHIQTRSRGTVCGSIAHADPSSELPLCLSTMGGELTLVSRRRKRTVKARDFFVGALQTSRLDGELISEIRLPRNSTVTGSAFREFAIRHGDFAIISVAVLARTDGLTIGIGGGADRPEVRDLPLLEGTELDDALNGLAWSLDCQDDLHATASYRRHLIRTLGKQAVLEAVA